jgi:uncharacterized cupin superfamily protein
MVQIRRSRAPSSQPRGHASPAGRSGGAGVRRVPAGMRLLGRRPDIARVDAGSGLAVRGRRGPNSPSVHSSRRPPVPADRSTCGRPADSAHLAERLHAQTWAPVLYALRSSETTGGYHYDWCREHWALVLGGAPTLRHPGGQDVMAPGDIVCLPEGEAGTHQFLSHADEPARLLVCSAPVSGPSAAVYPDDNTYVLRVSGQTGYRFRLTDQLSDSWDGEPGAGCT